MTTLPSPRARSRRVLAALGALAIASAGLLPAANAGPDDGKPIATAGHIDSPQISYSNGELTLTSKGKVSGTDFDVNPLDSHVIYSGTGYNRNTGAQQFMFTIPKDPAFDFLNAAGQTWYMAPQLPIGNHEPIWIGFGADVNVPGDKYRDEVVYLDLIGVKGPGRVEALGFYEESGKWNTRRMLSSADTAYRSLAVNPGAHTHNATLFSRPGRYELTYQASARTKDGTIVRSKPTVQTWQVGGASPAESPSTPLEEAFAQAPDGTPKTPYTFTAAPTKGTTTGREDGRLTTYTFEAHDDSVTGTLNLSLQGFHFTDIPVKNGKATASYYSGGADSTLQATFIPAKGSTAPRWRSEPLAFDAVKRTISTTSDESTTEPVAPTPQDSRRLDFPQHALTDRSYTIKVTPLGNEFYRAEFDFADKALRAYLLGGIYDADDDEYPTEALDTMVGNGHGEKVLERVFASDGQYIRVDIKPHATMDFDSFSLRLPKDLPLTEPLIVTGEILKSGSSPEPTTEPTAEPTTPAPTPTDGAPGWQTCLGERVGLSSGHVDISATLKDGKLSSFLRDDTALVDKESVDRDIATVALVATDAARYSRPPELAGAEYDFLGKVGSQVYLLPAEQKKGVIWPGWNTQGIDYAALQGPVTLELSKVSGPGDLRIATPGAPGQPPKVQLDTSKQDTTIEVGYATHVHAAWVFTEPGVYEFDVAFTAKAKDSSDLSSPKRPLKVIVGSKTSCDVAPSPSEPTEKPTSSDPAPSDSVTPSAAPSSKPGPTLPVTGASVPAGLILALLATGGTTLLVRRKMMLTS